MQEALLRIYRAGVRAGERAEIADEKAYPARITEVEPEFSEEARRAKFEGNVIVSLIVDTHGMPQNVHVLRGVGMGLDEKAVEAVKQYRFRLAMESGKPVAAYMNVDVGFHIY